MAALRNPTLRDPEMITRELIRSEFTCYYRGDEVDIERLDDLRARADRSAQGLASEAGSAEVTQFVALLCAMRDDRSHPMHEAIGISSELWWADDDEFFAVFRQLVDWMLAGLATPPASTAP